MKLRPDNPALAEGRSVFFYKTKPVSEMKRVLQPAANNSKRLFDECHVKYEWI